MSKSCDLTVEKSGDLDSLKQEYDEESGVEVSKQSCLSSRLWKLFSKETSTDRARKKEAREKEKEAREKAKKDREREITETTLLKLDDCPPGYPRTAAFLSSETNFSLYRGFSYLFSRVLLNLQDEIVALERELKEFEPSKGFKRLELRLKSREKDNYESRKEKEAGKRTKPAILSELESKLMTYGKILKQARDIGSFQKPSERDYKSVRTWFWNKTPLVQKEREFIKYREDIITLHNGREWSAFDGIVEKLLISLRSSFVRKIFSTPELREKTTDPKVYYYSRARIEYFVGMIITSLIFVLLVVPVVVMYEMTSVSQSQHSTFTAIGVLIIFTLLFSAAMGLLTVAKRHEIFAASAAYCAVLVVFISNFNG